MNANVGERRVVWIQEIRRIGPELYQGNPTAGGLPETAHRQSLQVNANMGHRSVQEHHRDNCRANLYIRRSVETAHRQSLQVNANMGHRNVQEHQEFSLSGGLGLGVSREGNGV